MNGTLVYWVPDGANRMRALKLTFCADDDRGAIPYIRRKRLARILREAGCQGAKLSYRDLSMIMLSSKATLKRDMRFLRNLGLEPGENAGSEMVRSYSGAMESGVLPPQALYQAHDHRAGGPATFMEK